MDKAIFYSFKIFLLKKLARFSRLVWKETARGGRSRSHTSNIVPAQWPRGLGALNPVLTLNIYFRLSRFQSSLLLLIGVHTAPKYGTLNLSDMFQDQRGEVSLNHRKRAEIILCVKRSPFWCDFRCGAKATRKRNSPGKRLFQISYVVWVLHEKMRGISLLIYQTTA